MIASFIITFRETLEASLIISAVLAYLSKTRNSSYSKLVWIGALAGILSSILAAFVFVRVAGGLTGRAEEIFEGIVMLAAAAVLTYMLLWFGKTAHARLKADIEGGKAGLFLISFISVFREGVETILFLAALSYAGGISAAGGFAGVAAALAVGYLFYLGARRLNIKVFFGATSVLLLLFAAGLVAHGIHEFQEAGVLPVLVEHVWDVNPILNEESFVGGLAKALLGYNGNPSLLEAVSYLLYIVFIVLAYKSLNTRKAKHTRRLDAQA